MGSRKRGNYGGSGKPKTRQDWVVHKKNKKLAVESKPFESIEELDEYLSHDLIRCLECGLEFKSLGHHLSRAHAMSSKQYRVKYNIPKSRSLFCASTRILRENIMKDLWGSGAMEEHRELLRGRMKKMGSESKGNTKHFTSTIWQKEYTNICQSCGESFSKKRDKYKFCSIKCYQESEQIKEHAATNGRLGGLKRAEEGFRSKDGRFKKGKSDVRI